MMMPIAVVLSLLLAAPVRAEVEDISPEAVADLAESHLALGSERSRLKELRAAKKEYRAWLAQGANRETARAFLKEFRALKKEFKATGRSDGFQERLAAGGKNYSCSIVEDSGGQDAGLHVFIVGVVDFSCQEAGGRVREAVMFTVGPGLVLLQGTYGGVVACTGKSDAFLRSFGVGITAGIGPTAWAGLYFGRNGLCAAFLEGGGFGAGAGVAGLELK